MCVSMSFQSMFSVSIGLKHKYFARSLLFFLSFRSAVFAISNFLLGQIGSKPLHVLGTRECECKRSQVKRPS